MFTASAPGTLTDYPDNILYTVRPGSSYRTFQWIWWVTPKWRYRSSRWILQRGPLYVWLRSFL